MIFTKGKTECTPSEAGYDKNRLDVLNKHLWGLVEDGTLQCAAYCISRRGKVFAHGAVGYKTYKKDPKLPVSPTDIQYIASATKPFAGVAIMKLVEDGVTRLDVPVGEILPQFNQPPFNGINLFHLMTHTSGLHADGNCFPNSACYWDAMDKGYQAWKNDKSKKKEPFDWIKAALSVGVRMEPDREWAYCSFGITVLGEVIHKLTGIHSHKYIEDYICKPLGMKDTAFDLTPAMAKRYIIQRDYTEKYVSDILNGKSVSEGEPWAGIPEVSGGLKSTVWDMVRFMNMALYKGTFNGTRILGRKAAEKMTAIAIEKPDYCWGAGGSMRGHALGFDHRYNPPAFTFSEGTFMHEGAGHCSMYADPEEELAAAWIIPYSQDGWFPKAVWSTGNIIWSGLI